jgi:Protein of unknown function (DUF1488)
MSSTSCEIARVYREEPVMADYLSFVNGETPVLDFPNQSRFFDPARLAVRFWGHDRTMEWSFFVTEAALKKLQPNARRDETGLLRAFDANREKIYVAARRAYASERRKSYELGAGDF